MPFNLTGNTNKIIGAYMARDIKATKENTKNIADKTDRIDSNVQQMPKALLAQNNALMALQNKITEKTNNNYRIGDMDGAINGKYDADYITDKIVHSDWAFGEPSDEGKYIKSEATDILLNNPKYKDYFSNYTKKEAENIISKYSEFNHLYPDQLKSDEFMDIYTKIGSNAFRDMMYDYYMASDLGYEFKEFYKEYDEASKDKNKLKEYQDKLNKLWNETKDDELAYLNEQNKEDK